MKPSSTVIRFYPRTADSLGVPKSLSCVGRPILGQTIRCGRCSSFTKTVSDYANALQVVQDYIDHMAVEHNSSSDPSEQGCPFCGAAFSSRSELSEHALRRPSRGMWCRLCNYVTSRSMYMYDHMCTFHQGQVSLTRQFSCSASFFSRGVLPFEYVDGEAEKMQTIGGAAAEVNDRKQDGHSVSPKPSIRDDSSHVLPSLPSSAPPVISWGKNSSTAAGSRGGNSGRTPSDGASTLRPWRCPLCPKAYIRKGELLTHRLYKHSPVRGVHRCHACGRTYPCESDLKRHRLTCAKLRDAKAPACSTATASCPPSVSPLNVEAGTHVAKCDTADIKDEPIESAEDKSNLPSGDDIACVKMEVDCDEEKVKLNVVSR